jgi:glycosyltransferase involved in cell wall biosynthesis
VIQIQKDTRAHTRLTMRISIILACYNNAKTIGQQLEAIASQHWTDSWEVIVSDNGSTDDSLEVVEQYRSRLPELRVVHAGDRRGCAHAKHVGAQAATGEALLFCDSDDEVAPGWLMAMGQALSQLDFVACRIDTKKLNPGWTQIHDSLQQDGLLKLRFYPYLYHAGGCSLGVKRDVYEVVGGFDETFTYVSDAEFCCKVQLSGVALHFVPSALLYYRYRTTCRGIYRQARNWGRESVHLFKKYRLRGQSDRWRWHAYIAAWRTALKDLPSVPRNANARARFSWVVGWQVGLLLGSVRYWIPPPCGE